MESVDSVDNREWTPQSVFNVTEKMQQVERIRASDRAIIDGQFNGARPYTPEEVERYQIQVNVNWGEGKRIFIPAVNQLNNALIFKERFFTASSKKGKPEKKEDYGEMFTQNIHVPLKTGLTGLRQMFLLKSRNAALGLHGIGPIMWMNQFRWRGRFIPLEDLLIPTDTLCDFSNLMFFAANLYLTAGEFFDMAGGEEVDDGWDQSMVSKILDDLVKPRLAQSQNWQTIWDQPEKRVEWLKQNRCMWDYDAVTTIKLRYFFYKSHDTKKWHRCVILREGTPNVPADTQKKFIYDGGKKVFANRISEIMHIQYGDNSVVAPLKHQSVRGLGVDLYGPVECINRTRCEFQQHALINMKTWLRINNPVDRDRPKILGLAQYSVVEDGISFVKNDERYEIDPNLAEAAMSMTKQIMGESGSSYVKDIESGSSQPRTATETNALTSQATESVSNMLQSVYAQEEFYWEEVVRRFCDKMTDDEEVKEFRQQCIADGIPEELMVPSNWKIRIERVLGAGDQMMANQEAGALLSQSQRFDPASQRKILRRWTTTITRDPRMAEDLVPNDPNEATPGTIAAEDVFGTLMQGIPASVRQGIDRVPYVEAMIGMMGAKIQQITQIDNMGTPQELLGLQAVGQHIGQNIQILDQDPDNKQKVKMYSDELGKQMNLVKGFGQRQQEAQQKAQEASAAPVMMEAQAKVQAMQMQAETKAQIAQGNAEQKLEQKQQQFLQKTQHQQAQFEQKMQQEMANHLAEMQKQIAQTNADLIAKGLHTGADLAAKQATTKVDVESKKKLAAAAPATGE